MNVLRKGVFTGAEIWDFIGHELLNEESYIKDRDYDFVQYDKKTPNGVYYSTAIIIPTEDEQKRADYQTEKQKALSDLNIIRENMTLGMATQADYDARLALWLEYHEANKEYAEA